MAQLHNKSGIIQAEIRSIGASHTATADDYSFFSAGSGTLTLPLTTNVGREYEVIVLGADSVTVSHNATTIATLTTGIYKVKSYNGTDYAVTATSGGGGASFTSKSLKTAYISQINGNDSTAIPGSRELTYATLQGAYTAIGGDATTFVFIGGTSKNPIVIASPVAISGTTNINVVIEGYVQCTTSMFSGASSSSINFFGTGSIMPAVSSVFSSNNGYISTIACTKLTDMSGGTEHSIGLYGLYINGLVGGSGGIIRNMIYGSNCNILTLGVPGGYFSGSTGDIIVLRDSVVKDRVLSNDASGSCEVYFKNVDLTSSITSNVEDDGIGFQNFQLLNVNIVGGTWGRSGSFSSPSFSITSTNGASLFTTGDGFVGVTFAPNIVFPGKTLSFAPENFLKFTECVFQGNITANGGTAMKFVNCTNQAIIGGSGGVTILGGSSTSRGATVTNTFTVSGNTHSGSTITTNPGVEITLVLDKVKFTADNFGFSGNVRIGEITDSPIPILANTTTGAVTDLFTINTLSNRTYDITMDLGARKTGGTAGTDGDSASYLIRNSIKNVEDTLSNVAGVGPNSLYTKEDVAGRGTDIVISGVSIRCQFTGATNTNIRVKGKIDINMI